MGERPAGTLTFVFTDIEASTRRWQAHERAMREALRRHDALLADAFEGGDGRIFKHTGDGMCAAFTSPSAALAAAIDAQRGLLGEAWDDVGGLAVRMALHTGEAHERDGDYFGPALNRAARLMGVAHGGQILVSEATAALVAGAVPAGVDLVDLGEHTLRDLDRPERIYEVTAPGLPAGFPALRTDAAAQAVPTARSSFVGRAEEIDQIRELVDAAPLVTLVGIGGAGKTRLAMEVASRAHGAWDEVHFVELAPLSDGRQIPGAIATVLGISVGGPGAGSVIDVVVAALARRRALLVLDNCEHLVEDCADFVDELLERCPPLSILATSREALAVEGERTWPVGSLPEADAVRLFVDRALAVDPHFRVDAENEAVVADICRRLDGIPLAIELAASRIAHLSPGDLAARLDDRFRLLTGGRRRRAQRQQTLQAAIDWSHDLLDEDERRLLRRLSVFAGGFTLDAAEQICAGDDVAPGMVVDVLGSLIAKSLVGTEHGEGGTRYRMLETIRLYAAERLFEAGEVEPLRDRHRDHWLAWVERYPLDEAVLRPDVGEVLDTELDNLRAALDWSESQDRPDLAMRQALGMGAVWSITGHHDEGERRLSTLVEGLGSDPAMAARGLGMLSMIRMVTGDFIGMEEASRRSLEIDPDGPMAAPAYVWKGLYRIFDVQAFPEAHRLFDAARRVADHNGQPLFHALADGVECQFFVAEGEFDRLLAIAHTTPATGAFTEIYLRLAAIAALIAQADFDGALAQADIFEVGWGVKWSAPYRAVALAGLGRLPEARATARFASDDFLAQPYPLVAGDCLVAVASVALAEGDAERATELLETVIAERGLAGFRSPATFVLWRELRRQARSALDAATYEAAKARGRSVSRLDALAREAAAL